MGTAKPPANDWGLHVNECGIFASGLGKGRWLDFLSRDRDNRATLLWAAPDGGEWHVMCGIKADAAEARDLFLEVGFHKSHVRVARLSACQAKVGEQKRRVDEMFAGIAGDEADRAAQAELDEAWSWWVAEVMPDRDKDRQAAQDAYWAIVGGGGKAEALRLYREHVSQTVPAAA
jgi:hypothetical protein